MNTIELTKEEAMYLDWFNNYLTIEKFANDYNMTIKQANELIEYNKSIPF